MSSNNTKKFTLSTDTDLHFDMLADHSKLKIMPNLVDNKPDNSLQDNTDNSDDEIIDNVNSDSLKFNQSSEDNNDNNNDYNKDDYNKQKMLYDYKNKLTSNKFDKITEEEEDDSGINNKRSTEDNSEKNSDKKGKPTLSELYGMDEVPFHMLDKQTQKFKKMEKYAELLAIKNIGIKLTKEYNLHSDYEEMCFEVQYWTNFQKKKDAVNLGKNFMMNAVTALEFMNERYDPFGLKLKGWSDQMQIGMDGYSNVFGELYEKWKGSGRKMEPEIKLILMVSASAVSFHASKKMAEQLPGLDKVLESNPELLNKLQGVINSGISKSGNEAEISSQDTQRKMYDQMQQLKKQQQKFNELKQQQERIDSNTERLREQMKKKSSNNQKNNPKDINSILNRIRAQNAVDDADNILNDSSDNSERVTVESTLGKEEIINDSSNDSTKGETLTLGSDGKPKRRKRRGKPTISITT
jgi:hypothetical protein